MKTLHFMDSCLSASDIRQVAAAFSNLETFEYSAGPSGEGPGKFNVNEGVAGLISLTGQVQRSVLALVVYFDSQLLDRRDDFARSIKGLEGLKQLGVRVKIDVGVVGLVGFEDDPMVKFSWRAPVPRPRTKY